MPACSKARNWVKLHGKTHSELLPDFVSFRFVHYLFSLHCASFFCRFHIKTDKCTNVGVLPVLCAVSKQNNFFFFFFLVCLKKITAGSAVFQKLKTFPGSATPGYTAKCECNFIKKKINVQMLVFFHFFARLQKKTIFFFFFFWFVCKKLQRVQQCSKNSILFQVPPHQDIQPNVPAISFHSSFQAEFSLCALSWIKTRAKAERHLFPVALHFSQEN